MDIIKKISMVLVLIGALNWGLIGLFNFNLVTAIFGSMTMLSTLTYILVGIAALLVIFIPGCPFSNSIVKK